MKPSQDRSTTNGRISHGRPFLCSVNFFHTFLDTFITIVDYVSLVGTLTVERYFFVYYNSIDTNNNLDCGHAPAKKYYLYEWDRNVGGCNYNDKMADIQADSKAGAIIAQMMAKSASSHDDMAEAVKDNPALVHMMGRMTLLSLLKQSGAGIEEVQQLNRVLQGIKKPQ